MLEYPSSSKIPVIYSGLERQYIYNLFSNGKEKERKREIEPKMGQNGNKLWGLEEGIN